MNETPDSNDPSAIPAGFSRPGDRTSPLTIHQRVAWGEMDSFGHVNNAVYLSYLENVRFAYFEAVGVGRWHDEHGQGPILARVEIDYLDALTFPDELLVSTRTSRIGTKSFTLHNQIWSTRLGTLAARANTVIVMVDYEHEEGPRTMKIPEPIVAAIRRLDGI